MSKKTLFALWGGSFIVCAGLGFIPVTEGAARFALTAVSVFFFLPPAVLIYLAARDGDADTLKLLRNLSALSLGLTLALLVANVLAAVGTEALGTVLHIMLVIVSAPMVCSGYWAVSLFLWACVLMGSLSALKGLTQKR